MCTQLRYFGISEQLSLRGIAGKFHTGQDTPYPPQAAWFLYILCSCLSPPPIPRPRAEGERPLVLILHECAACCGSPMIFSHSLIRWESFIFLWTWPMLWLISWRWSPAWPLPSGVCQQFASTLKFCSLNTLFGSSVAPLQLYSLALGTGCFQQSLKVQNLLDQNAKNKK